MKNNTNYVIIGLNIHYFYSTPLYFLHAAKDRESLQQGWSLPSVNCRTFQEIVFD